MALATLVNWLANTLVGFTFPAMERGLGKLAFLPFLVAIGVLGAFLFVYLPETKGRTVEEVADELSEPKAWSGAYNRRKRGALLQR